jgi:cytidylate kinase
MTDTQGRGPIIAIDGPAGAGKSTLARRLALNLGLPHINTGLMYRAVTARGLEARIDADDEKRLSEVARRLRFRIEGSDPPELRTDLDDESALTALPVEAAVSRVSRHPSVRRILRDRQRELGRAGCVMEGRDIGTVVFPDADLKIFLSAGLEVRVGRRAGEWVGHLPIGEIAEAVERRDQLDARTNPFVPAPDAKVLDTTLLSADEVFEAALHMVYDVPSRRSETPGERP